MTDLDARRQLRRNRILQNSENRLRKILGNDSNDCTNENKSIKNWENPINTQNEFKNNFYDMTYDNGFPSELEDDRDVSDENELLSCTLIRKKSLEKENKNECKLQTIQDDIARSDNYNTTYQSKVDSSHPLMMPAWLLSNRIIFIILAAIVNTLFAINYEHLLGKTIIIPCITVTMLRIYYFKMLQKSEESSFLITACFLCNIRPELTSKIKLLVLTTLMICNDLAVYIFCFTLMHYIGSLFKTPI
ncbi:uncharacterized protein [Prorops nasuta]|uniref:uncharacterized protein n=1 Tax=Prorops nasuta TaxID=863751 RepID=UPI0034CDD96E